MRGDKSKIKIPMSERRKFKEVRTKVRMEKVRGKFKKNAMRFIIVFTVTPI